MEPRNRRLSDALKKAGRKNGDVVVATKWSPIFRTAESITSTIQQRLDCLAPFAIDLHQIHHPFGMSSVEAEMKAMAALVADKKIRAVGVSNFGANVVVIPGASRVEQAVENRGALELDLSPRELDRLDRLSCRSCERLRFFLTAIEGKRERVFPLIRRRT
jgi:aryl-alcohol dehydrogenase-like predicted oxidoreductase